MIEKFLSCLTQRNIVNLNTNTSTSDFRPRANFTISIKDEISESLLKFFKNFLNTLEIYDKENTKSKNKMRQLLQSIPKAGEKLESNLEDEACGYDERNARNEKEERLNRNRNQNNSEDEDEEEYYKDLKHKQR